MATFNARVESVIELYLHERFVEMEEVLDLMYKHDPQLYKECQLKLEDMIAEQHYLDEGEELDLW